MSYLKESGVILNFKKTEVEEDKGGVDFYVDTKDGKTNQPVQFKTRREKWRDLPICRFQPFRGYEKSTVGRDYRSLKDKKNVFYYVASSGDGKNYDKITITCTSKILNLIEEAEKEWFGDEIAWSYFTEELYNNNLGKKIYNKKLKVASNGVEAWFKKNFNNIEGFGKINLYVPESLVDLSVDLKGC